MDHQRKGNFRSVCLGCCFFGGRAGHFDETKEVVARISRTAANCRMLERIARGGKSRRIARSENSSGTAASKCCQFFTDALPNSRDRCFEKLLPTGDGQKSRARDVWV